MTTNTTINYTTIFNSYNRTACRNKIPLSTNLVRSQGSPRGVQSAWDLVRASIEEVRRAEDDVVDEYERLCQGIYQICSNLKKLLSSRSPQLMSGVSRFSNKFNKHSSSRLSESKLASCFHQFGWDMGKIRHGKRIPIQATAAGRRT